MKVIYIYHIWFSIWAKQVPRKICNLLSPSTIKIASEWDSTGISRCPCTQAKTYCPFESLARTRVAAQYCDEISHIFLLCLDITAANRRAWRQSSVWTHFQHISAWIDSLSAGPHKSWHAWLNLLLRCLAWCTIKKILKIDQSPWLFVLWIPVTRQLFS